MTFSNNKKAFYEYELIDTIEAGMVLEGPEVKSIRIGRVNLQGSFCSIENNECWLKQCTISSPDNIGYATIDETRNKKLLLHKKQIQKLKKKLQEKGYTLIVTSIYQPENSKTIKCSLSLAKGKSNYDKRHSLKEKQQNIEVNRAIKDL